MEFSVLVAMWAQGWRSPNIKETRAQLTLPRVVAVTLGGADMAKRTLMERCWAKIQRTEAGCWEWTGWRSRKGYGQLGNRQAHRALYELLVEPVADNLDLDHLCRNRACVNPAHLEPVTRRENINRGHAARGLEHKCGKGHDYTPENTGIDRKGHRYCRECGRIREHEWRAEQMLKPRPLSFAGTAGSADAAQTSIDRYVAVHHITTVIGQTITKPRPDSVPRPYSWRVTYWAASAS